MANQYGIYLSKNNTVLRIPVNPESYRIEKPNDNETYNVLGIGQIVVARTPQLQRVTWNGFFPSRPSDPYVLTSGGFLPAQKYIEFLQGCMDNREIIRFVANRCLEDGTTLFDTNMQVLVTGFNVDEKGGEAGDFYYEIELTEYRDYTPLTVDIQIEQEHPRAVAESNREIPQGQIVVGSTVICNGNYYYSSYGDEPHGTFNNYRGKVSKIVTSDPTRPYPIHITSESGGWLGWVKSSQCQVVAS